jgi:hypothetical protein
MENLSSAKMCEKCLQLKPLDEFHPTRKWPKSYCLTCLKEVDKAQYQKQKTRVLAKKKEDYAKNKEKYAQKNKKYYDANRDTILKYKADYYVANREQVIAKFREKYNSDLEFRLKHVIRRRTRAFLAGSDELRYEDMIGCSHEQLISWFEYNFWLDGDLGMNWENYGELWQIDHVYPLSKVENLATDTFFCSWKNLRPIPRSTNASKNDTLNLELVEEQANRVDDFEYFREVPTSPFFASRSETKSTASSEQSEEKQQVSGPADGKNLLELGDLQPSLSYSL